jgi:hypothetical protein
VSIALLVAASSFAQPPGMGGAAGQMPDPKAMSGMPLPVGDVPSGTVTVRVIRGQLSNPLSGQTVDLSGAGEPKSAKTDDSGHAVFSGLPAGARVKTSVTVDGEKIDSQEFDVPATGGVRLVLVATDPELEKKAAEDRKLAQEPPVPGTVVLGEQSRFVLEMGDDGLNVFTMAQIVNTARRPVQTAGPLVFEVPRDAQGTAVLEGSSPNATAANSRVTVIGPFPPGATNVQFAYTLALGSDSLTITEKVPVQMTQFTLLAQKTGDMTISSPQMATHRETVAEGQAYIVGQGPAVKPGETVTITLSGLPHQPAWPRNVALFLSVVILIGGAWGAARPRVSPDEDARRRKLRAKRDQLFADLASLEEQRRQRTIDETRYAARRQDLVEALERVYAQLDHEAAA